MIKGSFFYQQTDYFVMVIEQKKTGVIETRENKKTHFRFVYSYFHFNISFLSHSE